MAGRPRIFNILKSCDGPSVDEALVAGALHVKPQDQLEIVAILLERANHVGLKALPALHSKLDPEAQELIIAKASLLFGALRMSIRSSNSQTRTNTLEIIRRSGTLRLAYLAALAIHDGSPTVRAEAAMTLQVLTETHCRNYDETITTLRDAASHDGSLSRAVVYTLKLLRDERQFLIAAIKDALNGYESHHRPEIVEAAMVLADGLEESLFQQSTLKRGKLTHAMLEIFTGSLSPRLVPFAYLALGYSELRRRIITALSTHQDPVFFAEFIRHHWLARDPSIRKNLVAIRSLAFLNDGLEAAFSLPVDVALLTPGWILSLGLPSDQKVTLLLNFLLIEDPAANRAATLALVKTNTPVSTLALQSILSHEDPALVRIAQREIDYREHSEHRLVRKPSKDRPEAWSDLLQRAGLREDFDDLWRHFDRLHPVQAKTAGRHAYKYVPGFMTQVQVKLLSTHAADRLRALRLILALHATDGFQRDAFAMANDPTPEVRAAAMTALGCIGEATSRRILERALGDDAPAVQVSAIDALEQMGTPHRDRLIIPKTESDDPNVRATSIRVLLKMKLPKAAAALISMLEDARADHRCAALWVVDQLRLVSVVPRILAIEKKEADPRIARIAQHVRRRLERLQPKPSTEKAEPAEASHA